MTPSQTPNTPPKIFDQTALERRRQRASRRTGQFFIERCVEDLADRLLDINREFSNVALFGTPVSASLLKTALPPEKALNEIALNPDLASIDNHSLDLVISLLQMQNDNDPVGTLIQMRQKLKPDGLMIVAMFGGETLTELRHAFYEADTQYLGGVSPRVDPFADHTQAAQLLSRAGLALPVVDIDRFTVNYKALSTLFSDIRDLGETNVMHERSQKYLGKDYLLSLFQAHERTQSSGKFKTSFEILWLTGWAPHESQQKPAERGSASIGLGDALKTIRKNSKNPE